MVYFHDYSCQLALPILRHLFWVAGQKIISQDKKRYRGHIVFVTSLIIALIEAQVCDLTNRFHFCVRLYCNRSQVTS